MTMDAVYITLFSLVGLTIGSFLNVLIYRLPRKNKVIFGRSACPSCGQKIAFYDNIPLLSYVILLGRCRGCKKPISPRYPIVEALNAGMYVLFYLQDGLGVVFAAHAFLSSALIAIFFIDFEFQIIPDKITLPGILVGLGFSFFTHQPGIVDAILGVVVGGCALLAVAYLGEWLFKKDAMGGGDIKMAAMMGAFVGWQKILLVFMTGAVIGLIGSLVWMAISAKIREERLIPFGPFLAIAAIVVIMYGDQIMHFYRSTFLPVTG